MTKFPVKQRKELGNNLPHVDCEDVASEANHFNDVKHSWVGLNSCFLASPKHTLTFLIVGDSISASRHVRFIANLVSQASTSLQDEGSALLQLVLYAVYTAVQSDLHTWENHMIIRAKLLQ